MMPALAASILALCIGFGGGFVVGGARDGGAQDRLQRDEAARLGALHAALETGQNGETLEWGPRDGPTGGRIVPVVTYLDATGRFCREFEQRDRRNGAVRTTRGVACRDEGGRWHVLMTLFPDAFGETASDSLDLPRLLGPDQRQG